MKKTILSFLLTLLALASATVGCPAQRHGVAVGTQAPEITVRNPDGKEIRLSDLRGKVVLVDFWASWCGPCRAENPNLVKAYSLFHEGRSQQGDGFEIFSVSLDVTLDRWKKAIAADNLSWSWHGCDFGGWQSPNARKYGVTQIPSNFLIDGKGKVIAVNLRGQELPVQLRRIFSQK